jgi:hypothetical protein
MRWIVPYFVILFVWTGCLFAETNTPALNLPAKGDVSLGDQLRITYSRYREAMKNGDMRSLQTCLSTFSVLEWKNSQISSGERFDGEYLKSISSMTRPLEGFEELAVRQNKDAAKLILFGKPTGAKDSGNVHIVPSFLAIDFLRENGTWKVDKVGGKMPSQRKPSPEKIILPF